ncbi:dTDP-4-amino-4,6-dideoxy-D-galactose acyltransferase [Enterobacteriaceae bacterium ESL0689]|nr:dTDP-4-amino-4,6-dideoxy-D-galactose acyltransferase [Enterobacteriaceae bacterium ESL0689]
MTHLYSAPCQPLHARLEFLEWESRFFGLDSAILHFDDDASPLNPQALAGWARVQAKVAASDTARIEALQQRGFQLVEGEIDLLLPVGLPNAAGGEVATSADIPRLRQLAAQAFTHSRFRSPWYAANADSCFYAQWIENAVRGRFDDQCLIFRAANGDIRAFVSLRQHNETQARIGLLAGRGAGAELIQAAQRWAYDHGFSALRVATQMGNTAALKRYIMSGANIAHTAYWLYR